MVAAAAALPLLLMRDWKMLSRPPNVSATASLMGLLCALTMFLCVGDGDFFFDNNENGAVLFFGPVAGVRAFCWVVPIHLN